MLVLSHYLNLFCYPLSKVATKYSSQGVWVHTHLTKQVLQSGLGEDNAYFKEIIS